VVEDTLAEVAVDTEITGALEDPTETATTAMSNLRSSKNKKMS